jgi:hypothetical protein
MTAQYVPGTCNIGPDEIALRRRAGHVGLAVAVMLVSPLGQEFRKASRAA